MSGIEGVNNGLAKVQQDTGIQGYAGKANEGGQEDSGKAGAGEPAAHAYTYALLSGTSEMVPGVLRVSTLRHFIFPPSF